MYEPDDINGDKHGQQRRRADDAVGRQETWSGFVDGRRGLSAGVTLPGGGRRLAVVLVVPLVSRQDNVARSRYGRRLVRSLRWLDVEELGQIRQRKVFQR